MRAGMRRWASVLVLAGVLVAPTGVASADDGVAAWHAAHAGFMAKGAEIVADFTVLFDAAWVAAWEADLDAMEAAAAAMAAAGIIDVAADVAAAADAARSGAENLALDAGASLTAAYDTFGALHEQVAAATADMDVAPAPAGNAGLASVAGGASSALVLALAALAAFLVAGGRIGTGRRAG
jgi:hypothetical protein